MKIKAKGHGDPRISSDAYFLGLCLIWAAMEGAKADALLEEIQRVGRFEFEFEE